jgi:hypothetical protein
MKNILKAGLSLLTGALVVVLLNSPLALGQSVAEVRTAASRSAAESVSSTPSATPDSKKDSGADSERITALEESLRAQAAQLEQMRKLMAEQQKTIQMLSNSPAQITPATVSAAGTAATTVAATANKTGTNESASTSQNSPATAIEERLKKVEDRVLKIGPFKFSGDFRLRADGILRSASKAPDPALAHAQNVRARYRLRLNFDTDLYPNLSFHGQLATGPVNNPLTLDQDFSSTTVRHPFFLSEAWVDYHPKKSVQLQGGRVQEIFADNSRFLFDDDIRFNGFNEKYIWSPKNKPLNLSSIELRAGQYILSNPNVAIIAPGSPLANAGQIVGTSARSANLFHQGILLNQQLNKRWSDQFGGDLQLYRNPNQIALASTTDGLTLLIQPGIGIALSGPLPGTGTATTTAGGAIYTARSFKIARLTYRLNYAGFEAGGHAFPITFNVQVARNTGTGLNERDALLAAAQVGRITKRGDTSFLYVFAIKGANSMISQVTDDDLGTGTGVNIRTSHLRFEYGIAKKVTFQSLVFIQEQLRNSGQFPKFFVPLGGFAPRTYRFQQQLLFSF